jgi:hypothetical protein
LVSRHPAIQTTGLLTVAPAGLPPAEHASLHWTHNRTCRSPASGSRTRLHAFSRATPSAVLEHYLELIGCPISMSFTTYCVCPELRSLPSTSVTRLQRYYEPLRHPRAPGLSLTGFRLVFALATPGASRVAYAFLVYMLSPLPRRSGWAYPCSFIPAVSAFPDMAVRSACALSFSRLARRSLALRPAHSRCHRIS